MGILYSALSEGTIQNDESDTFCLSGRSGHC